VTFDTELDVPLHLGSQGVARERGPDGGAGATTRAGWEKTVGIFGHVAYVHPLCRRYLDHCYRTLAWVAGRAATWKLRISAETRAELAAMIELLRASDELKGATPGRTRSKPRLPRRYISDASTTVGHAA
jgi:hypothetical protein